MRVSSLRIGKLHLVGISGFACFLLYSLVFGEQGLLDAFKMEVRVRELRQRVEAIDRRNQEMMDRILDVKRNPATYEKLARERLRLAKEKELIYVFSGMGDAADSEENAINGLSQQ